MVAKNEIVEIPDASFKQQLLDNLILTLMMMAK